MEENNFGKKKKTKKNFQKEKEMFMMMTGMLERMINVTSGRSKKNMFRKQNA